MTRKRTLSRLCRRYWRCSGVARRAFAIALARQSLGIPGHFGRQNLDGDIPAELGVASPVDLAHPAFADRAGDLVVGESLSDQEGLPTTKEEASLRNPPVFCQREVAFERQAPPPAGIGLVRILEIR
jgi:hypothetical protein